MLFGSNKESLLSLYNAINHTSYQNPDELEITTIDDVIYMGIKNDVSFLIGSDMNLYEAQSTKNPNMPLRGLNYFARIYEGYVAKRNLNIYGTRRIELPTPKYLVLYGGTRSEPPIRTYRLTDSFPDRDAACLECTALELNIHSGDNQEIVSQCRQLYEYVCFLEKVRTTRKEYPDDFEKAIDTAVQESIEEGILADFLKKHRAEVKHVLLTEYNEELHMKMTYEDGRRDGRREGHAEGRRKGRAEGRREGRAEGRREERRDSIHNMVSFAQNSHISRQETLKQLQALYSLSDAEAEQYLEQYWE
jgi:hypothetical protein